MHLPGSPHPSQAGDLAGLVGRQVLLGGGKLPVFFQKSALDEELICAPRETAEPRDIAGIIGQVRGIDDPLPRSASEGSGLKQLP